jgi:hypothetical protein
METDLEFINTPSWQDNDEFFDGYFADYAVFQAKLIESFAIPSEHYRANLNNDVFLQSSVANAAEVAFRLLYEYRHEERMALPNLTDIIGDFPDYEEFEEEEETVTKVNWKEEGF